MWDLPGPGLEPVSPALAGGFLTTVPPGKSPFKNRLIKLDIKFEPTKSFKITRMLVFEGCKTPFREMRIKTTIRYYFKHTRMTIFKARKITSVGEHVEKLEPSYTAGWNIK